MRRVGLAVFSLSVAALIVAVLWGAPARAALQQGTPAASPVASPAASPAAAPSNVITLIAWYQQDPSGDFLNIMPVTANASLTAGPAPATADQLTGKANFSGGPDGQPEITLGESTFDGVLANPDDPESMLRWTYYNGEQGARPSTLVIQIEATKGPYKGYVGTATFVSREAGANSSGALVIMLKLAS